MTSKKTVDSLTQWMIPCLTISAQVAIALKYPQWGLVINMASQPFWLYSGWKAYNQAGQSGILITTVIFTIITAAGIINYWVL